MVKDSPPRAFTRRSYQMAAAFELWDFGVWTPVLQSTFYGGLFQVGKAVLDGSFHRPSRKNIREIEETE